MSFFFFPIPLPSFCVFELKLFKGSLPLQFLPLYGLFLEQGEWGGGVKFRGVNCSRRGKLFPLVCSFFHLLSSCDLHGPIPIASLVPGQAVASTLCAQRVDSFPGRGVLACKLCSLLPPCSSHRFSSAFLGQPSWPENVRWSSRVLKAVKYW